VKAKKQTETETSDSESVSDDDIGLVTGCQVKVKKITWLWPGMLIENAVNLIDGRKGSGKSSLIAKIAATVCSGKPLPESRRKIKKGKCLWIGREESFESAILPRWIAAGGSPSSIITLRNGTSDSQVSPSLPAYQELLTSLCQRNQVRMIVLDPFSGLNNGLLDMNNESQARAYLESLGALAESCEATAVVTRHFRKGRSGTALEMGLGSIAIVNVARCVLRADKNPDGSGVSYLTAVESNHGPAEGAFAYRIAVPDSGAACVQWLGRRDVELRDILDGTEELHDKDERQDAITLLEKALKNGPRESTELIKEARSAGVGESTLRKAKAKLGVTSIRKGGTKGSPPCWVWKLKTE
jgi:hypothetical protein